MEKMGMKYTSTVKLKLGMLHLEISFEIRLCNSRSTYLSFVYILERPLNCSALNLHLIVVQ